MEIDSINQFDRQLEVEYKGEKYFVRDNGAVCRQARSGQRKRKLDDFWTFGRPDDWKGYMNIGPHVVHRIVATAFHGVRPSDNHIVDHIDTNRRNNRAENLRWVTRLENLLLNPITLKRIISVYGSLDEFFENPGFAAERELDFSWMRTVTKEEAAESRKNLLKWAESGQIPKGGRLGEWIFGPQQPNATTNKALADKPSIPPFKLNQRRWAESIGGAQGSRFGQAAYDLRQPNPFAIEPSADQESLTPMAIQRRWRTPSEFPNCPNTIGSDPLGEYVAKLTPGSVFTRNIFGETLTLLAGRGDGLLVVMNEMPENAVKGWAVAKVTVEDGKFVHESQGTFFSDLGAQKKYCDLLNLEAPSGDCIDDYC